MSDARLRELERRWKETGSAEDELRYLRERLRRVEDPDLETLRRAVELDDRDEALRGRYYEALFPTRPEVPRAAHTIPDLLPLRFGEYLLLSRSKLGEWGPPSLFGAWNRAADSRCGVYPLGSELSQHVSGDPPALALIERRIALDQALAHPSLARVLAWGSVGAERFLALDLDLSRGTALDQLEGRDPTEVVLLRCAALAEAIGAAHARGEVHGCVSPNWVHVDARGGLRLMPFTLASLASVHERYYAQFARPMSSSLQYLSPEAIMGKPLEPTSDVFQLGVLLHESLAGRRPFEGETMIDIARQVIMEDAPPLRRHWPKAPAPLEAVCLRALAREPERRYPDAGALAADLRRVLGGEPVEAPPPRRPLRGWLARLWPLTVLLLCAALLPGCAEPATQPTTKTEGAVDAEPSPALSAVRDILSDPSAELVLYRLVRPAFAGRVWTYTKQGERPNPMIPTRTLGAKARARLVSLVRAKHLRAGKGQLPSYSYLLEVVRNDAPVARIDFHTEGEGAASLFVIDPKKERLSAGSAQLILSATARSKWLRALDGAWAAAGP